MVESLPQLAVDQPSSSLLRTPATRLGLALRGRGRPDVTVVI